MSGALVINGETSDKLSDLFAPSYSRIFLSHGVVITQARRAVSL